MKARGISTSHMVESMMTMGAKVSPVVLKPWVKTWTAFMER